jgi:hypothetical protein
VLRAAGEAETTQENIHDWLQLNTNIPGFELLRKEETVEVIFFTHFHQRCLNYKIFLSFSYYR